MALAVLDPRVGHTMDVLSSFISTSVILIDSSTESFDVRPHRRRTQTAQPYSPGGANVPHVTHASFGQPESTTQMISRNTARAHGCSEHTARVYMGRKQKCTRHLLTAREDGWRSRAVITGSVFRAPVNTARVHGPFIRPPYCIFKNSKFLRSTGQRPPKCVILSNFVKIDGIVIELWQSIFRPHCSTTYVISGLLLHTPSRYPN